MNCDSVMRYDNQYIGFLFSKGIQWDEYEWKDKCVDIIIDWTYPFC